MIGALRHPFRSTPIRLALALVALFSIVSLLSLGISYVVARESLDRSMRQDLAQDIAGFRAAPTARALAALIDAEAEVTDPGRIVLSYRTPSGRYFGNAALRRSATGYDVVLIDDPNTRISGPYLALTTPMHGGQLTIARSRAEIAELRGLYVNLVWLSLIPTVLLALGGGLYMAYRSGRRVAAIEDTLDALTSGDLTARTDGLTGRPNDLSHIAEKLDRMAEAQETSVSALRQISADIAHDLKTPIQRVSVHLSELAQSARLSAEDRAHVDKAVAELDGISSVFRSLLQIAQIETGTPKSRFKPIDLNRLAETFVEIYAPVADDAGRTLRLDLAAAPLSVMGDRDLLGQALANLIENALRHTPPGSIITISTGADNGKGRLTVSDNGLGVPEAEREKVVQRLYRLDRSRTTPGSGLGLSFASVVATLHDATLKLEDNAPGLSVSIMFR